MRRSASRFAEIPVSDPRSAENFCRPNDYRRRDEAAAAIPDDLVIKSNLLGTDEMVKTRIRAYRDGGITSLSVSPAGKTMPERLATLDRFVDLFKAVDAEASTP